MKKRSTEYVVDRVASGVERALNCTILADLPEVVVVSDCSINKHGYFVPGSNEICIDKRTISLGAYFRDETLCHKMLHCLGIDNEETAHELDGKCVAYMPLP